MPAASSPQQPIGGSASASAATVSSSVQQYQRPLRPALQKRHSSQASYGHSSRAASMRDMASPGSDAAGAYGNNLRVPHQHQVKGKGHARIKLPRNHSSGRNLAKMGRQAQQQQFEQQHQQQLQVQQRHGRQRSHEGDTEIRLPGSLDESTPVQSVRPQMRRNNTAFQLGMHQAHTKLKKNASHGQLTRLGSGRNLAALGSQKPPPSPGLKGKSKRPKSADFGKMEVEKDLHEQEVEIARAMQERREGPKKVGFAVGSSGDTSDGEDAPHMEGSGLEEGEWTEESASASPYSTRQNTANNSRRTSVVQEKPPERKNILPPGLVLRAKEELQQARREEAKVQALKSEEQVSRQQAGVQESEESEDADEEDEDDEEDPPSPRSQPQLSRHKPEEPTLDATKQQPQQPKPQRSPLHAAKEHPNPTAQFLRRHSGQLPAPAMVSNVTAMDAQHSTHASPAPSMQGSSNLDAGPGSQEDELVSRFIPSASHPTTGSAGNTTTNTPKTTHFHTPVEESTLASQHRPPISPGSSTISAGSSGAATPALGRSRIELKMLQEKAAADIESAAHRHPIIPAHVYDRRNESLKSYLNLAALGGDSGNAHPGFAPGPAVSTTALSLGPEIFQGRFKAIHTELRVVQKFRDPLAESLARLQSCKGTKLSLRTSPQKQQAAALRMSKSAVSLPASTPSANKRASQPPPATSAVGPTASIAKFSTSASPPKPAVSTGSPGKSALQGSKSSVQIQGQGKPRRGGHRGVSFAGTPPDVRESRDGPGEVENGPAMVARRLWESVNA